MIRIIPAACALAGLFVAAPAPSAQALAEPVREVFTPRDGVVIQQTSLEVSGPDLSEAASRTAVLGRIEAAAEAVCQARPPGGPEPRASAEQVECRRQAMARAVFQLHDPQLWAMAVMRSRQVEPRW